MNFWALSLNALGIRHRRFSKRSSISILLAALPPLGFSPKILGFSIESWVLGLFSEALGFFLGFFERPWFFRGFLGFSRENTRILGFSAESNEFEGIR